MCLTLISYLPCTGDGLEHSLVSDSSVLGFWTCHTIPRLCGAGDDPRASIMLGKQSAEWAVSPAANTTGLSF